MTFGEFFRQLRLRSKLTLRAFCQKNSFDPGNVSRLERGLFPAPHSEENLSKYAKALGIKEGSDEYITFYDLAMSSKLQSTVSHDDIDKKIFNMLPVLFRTVDNKDITQEKLDRIINIINEEVKK